VVSEWSSPHLFFFVHVPNKVLGTRSWDSNQLSHYQIGRANPDKNPWETKIKIMELGYPIKMLLEEALA
jgi:hypothetical protein